MPAAHQGWDVCARQTAGRLIDDLRRAHKEATPTERLLYAPLLTQARQIRAQLRDIDSAIHNTPEN